MLLIGRATGLVRDSVLSAKFGLTQQGDAAAILLSLPDLLTALLVSGGMSAALVPRLTKLSPTEQASLVRFAMIAIGGTFAILGLLFIFVPRAFFGILAPGNEALGSQVGTLAALAIGFALPLSALAGISGAWLNARGAFGLAGAGTLIVNLVIVLTMLFWRDTNTLITGLALGILAAASIRLVSQLAALPIASVFRHRVLAEGRRAILSDFAIGVSTVFLSLLPPVILRAAASFLPEGTLAATYYSQKLIELPVGVILSAIGTIALTEMSTRHAESGQGAADAATKHMRRALQLAIVAATAGAFFCAPAVDLVFGYGQMEPDDRRLVASLFGIGVCALPFTALVAIGANYLYATGQPRKSVMPTLVACFATPLFSLPALILQRPELIMVAFLAAQTLMGVAMLRRTRLPVFSARGILGGRTLKVAIISLLAMLTAQAAYRTWFDAEPLIGTILAGITAAAVGGLIFMPERRQA